MHSNAVHGRDPSAPSPNPRRRQILGGRQILAASTVYTTVVRNPGAFGRKRYLYSTTRYTCTPSTRARTKQACTCHRWVRGRVSLRIPSPHHPVLCACECECTRQTYDTIQHENTTPYPQKWAPSLPYGIHTKASRQVLMKLTCRNCRLLMYR